MWVPGVDFLKLVEDRLKEGTSKKLEEENSLEQKETSGLAVLLWVK